MAQIVANSDAMRDKASSFDTIAEDIEKIIGEIATAVKGLEDSWKGTAAETYAQEFLKQDTMFKGLYADIRAYRDFLNNAADAYDKAEGTNTMNG